jgi:hypothetical protein
VGRVGQGRKGESRIKGPLQLEPVCRFIGTAFPSCASALRTCCLGGRPDLVHNGAQLVLGEQVGHLARGQDVVHVLQEGLKHDLRLVKEEHGGLVGTAGLLVQALEILAELRL